jgi:tRNA(Arg) A34 adenosine deaminase TadA
MTDKELLTRAVQLAADYSKSGDNGPFGAVIARDGEIIAEGWNRVVEENDPTAHAEMIALREACQKSGTYNLEGCTLYASCEPCPMCLAAAYWAHLDAVYYASTKEDATAAGFDDDHIYREISQPPKDRNMKMVHLPVEEAKAIFKQWVENSDKRVY